ncbi:hypothetical protein GCM10007036_45430 [Alsobacter metallidurans]|uniref:Heme exporter protein D n=1 Tax=Alsobacter metallidurans TaxID=340221 RepID=A0A917IBU3_9HYPH|nr:heme exporter protein CcmD [Alsobacter metallidurans]GGH33086.1 hypothetical protein GCM10007036_45430 [Alsobacter metallidurans]
MGASHTGFILASYLMAAAVFVGLTVRAVLEHRAQKAQLARLEQRGARRRSEAA